MIDTYWSARRQESAHAACAAMRLYGLEIDSETLKQAARHGAGRYSDLALMDAATDLFRALGAEPAEGADK